MLYRRGWCEFRFKHEIHIDNVARTIEAINNEVLVWLLRGTGAWDSGSRYELTPQVLWWLWDNVGDADWDIERHSTYSLCLMFRHKHHATLFKLAWS